MSMATDAVIFHGTIAADFHASYGWDANRLERLRIWRDFLDRYAQSTDFAYDIGCGSGILTCELARRTQKTIGIDGAAPMLAIAKNTAHEQGLTNLSFQQHHLPIANTASLPTADILISSSVIEYLDSVSVAFAFLHKLLRDGGMVIFSVSNQDSISRKLVRLVYRVTGRPRYFGLLRHFMTIESIKTDLQTAGFTCMEYAYMGKSDWMNRFLAWFLPARFASNMIIVAARKT